MSFLVYLVLSFANSVDLSEQSNWSEKEKKLFFDSLSLPTQINKNKKNVIPDSISDQSANGILTFRFGFFNGDFFISPHWSKEIFSFLRLRGGPKILRKKKIQLEGEVLLDLALVPLGRPQTENILVSSGFALGKENEFYGDGIIGLGYELQLGESFFRVGLNYELRLKTFGQNNFEDSKAHSLSTSIGYHF